MSEPFNAAGFPRLLWKLYLDRATGVLDLQHGQVTKKIYLDGGQPVNAESNLLHETLAKYLVEQKLITAEQEQGALVKALETQQPFNEVVVQLGYLSAAQLYEALRKSLALKILDCFGWESGSATYTPDSAALEGIISLKMNPARLIIQGVSTFLPAESLSAEVSMSDARAFRVITKAGVDLEALQLNSEEVGLLKSLQEAKPLGELERLLGRSKENLARKLFAFRVFGLIEDATPGAGLSLDELVGAALLQSLKPVEAPPPVAQVDPETLALANEIAQEHMKLMSLNHFELLGAAEDAAAVDIRNRFMEFAVRYSPSKFRAPALGEFRAPAEEVFLRGVKAFQVLSDFDSKTKYLDKIKGERSKASKDGKKKPGEYFKIETKLLDGDAQFKKGLTLLRDKKYDAAIEHFQYAIDIDPRKGSYTAHLGWATYLKNPEKNAREAESILKKAREMSSDSEDAAFFLGKFLLAVGRLPEALEHLKRAVELAPKNPEMVRELRAAERAGKK